ncbi:hypothetical protein OIU14_08375 [Thalassobacter stenotrophicus]|uniref:hypothetical protein n=1 Tax=Thalassobacter stenotrophicus TaxID=266809 RepID=UPI0022A93E19|nr:hypothetical protein [Thalassobacter stenotrophicus]UYP67483.1 hypothetical protein OIU14_13505 [Thalassobacter stenotrophicus]UYP69719.1 hypothetical protein OIU14_08375 [Thalassobacter stenotrophicus]
MIRVVTALLAGLGQRAAFCGAIVSALFAALWIAFRQGRHAAEADLAIRRAEARIRAMQTSQEIRHEVQNADRADLQRRADRWMRD